MPAINQGEIYDYDFGPQQDQRQEGRRPCLVVQTDLLNGVLGYPLTIIVPLSTKGRASPSHVKIQPAPLNGLDHVSYAKCEQIYTIPCEGLSHRRGAISQQDSFRIKEALRIVLAL